MGSGIRPLLVFLAVACIPPWIGWSLLSFGVVPASVPFSQLLYLTGWSCSLGGLIATGMAEGGRGVLRLLGEAVRVFVPIKWWLFVLLVPLVSVFGGPLLAMFVNQAKISFNPGVLLALLSPAALLPFFLGPFGEEFGWRGFLLPWLGQRMPVLVACFIVGLIWAAWHWPLMYHSIAQSPLHWLATTAATITCMSFLLAAAYLRTRSLFLSMVMHWSFNAFAGLKGDLIQGTARISGAPLTEWCRIGVNALLVVLVIPMLLNAGSRGQPDHKASAPG